MFNRKGTWTVAKGRCAAGLRKMVDKQLFSFFFLSFGSLKASPTNETISCVFIRMTST